MNELIKKLIAIADENPERLEHEVMIKAVNGNISQINNAIYQEDAEETQLFVADC